MKGPGGDLNPATNHLLIQPAVTLEEYRRREAAEKDVHHVKYQPKVPAVGENG